MSKLYIQKKSVSELPKATGSISDTLNVEDKVTNAPSINLVTKLSGIPEEGIIAYEGDDIPEGYEETTNPITAIADILFPIGRGFIDFTDTDYSNWLGLTWERELVGMTPIGKDANDSDFATVGQKGGEKTHTLTKGELPNVKGGFRIAGNTVTNVQEGNLVFTDGVMSDNVMKASAHQQTRSYLNNHTVLGYADTTHLNQIDMEFGNNEAHNILQPYQVVSYWKRVDPNAKKMISFSIYTREYEAEEGMTFYEWVNSSYNTDSWKSESEGDYVTNDIISPGKVIYVNAPGGGSYLLSSETIIADYVYSQYAEK